MGTAQFFPGEKGQKLKPTSHRHWCQGSEFVVLDHCFFTGLHKVHSIFKHKGKLKFTPYNVLLGWSLYFYLLLLFN